MRFKGLVEEINHIVISETEYKNGDWCRYEKQTPFLYSGSDITM